MTLNRLRAAKFVGVLVGTTIVGLSLRVLVERFGVSAGRDVWRGFHSVETTRVVAAATLTVVAFALLSTYDHLALLHIRRRLGWRRASFAAFVASGIGQSIGASLLTGAAIRYRLYSSWGVARSDVAQVVAFTTASFWLGVLSTSGMALAVQAGVLSPILHLPARLLSVIGVSCLLIVVGYVCVSWRRRPGASIGSLRFTLPSPPLALAQTVVASLDWLATSAILYVLLPPHSGVGLAEFAGIFVVAQLVGALSHVPGGLGVFDTLMLAMLSPRIPAGRVAAALITFRVLYYLVPLAIASALLAVREAGLQRLRIRNVAHSVVRRVSTMMPAVLSLATFSAGVVLLVSGATPAVHSREVLLQQMSPTPLIESAYFVSSLIGVALLFVSRGLQRRLDGAYALAVPLLVGGVVASLLKGLDFEEAIYLFAVLLALLPARRRFSRHASLLAEPLTRSWTVAILAVLSASVWLVFFGHRHVRFANDVWGHVAIINATRALWMTAVAVVTTGLLGLLRLLRPAQPRAVAPDASTVARAHAIARTSPTAGAHLSIVGDKALLFGVRGDSFLMYGIAGRSWIAMGDPVGDVAERSALAWRFRELAAQHAADAAFYLVAPENLPLYVEMGLRLFKMGETARVPLATFTLDGGAQKWLRRARRQVVDDGCTLSVLAPADVAPALSQMQNVSDAWMAT
ncbi:MAG: phosphatidylglycerol lysyltransferase domain-containing protein, partial [Gemmatimonadota bacterium]